MQLTQLFNPKLMGFDLIELTSQRKLHFIYEVGEQSTFEHPKYYFDIRLPVELAENPFSDDEMKVIKAHLRQVDELDIVGFKIARIMGSAYKDDIDQILKSKKQVSLEQINQIYEKANHVYALFLNQEFIGFQYTSAELSDFLNRVAEEDHKKYATLQITYQESRAISTIQQMAVNHGLSQALIQAFLDKKYTKYRTFVAEQLDHLTMDRELDDYYFTYLMKHCYPMGVYQFNVDAYENVVGKDEVILGFEDYSIRYINELIYDTFEEKIDIRSLLKNL